MKLRRVVKADPREKLIKITLGLALSLAAVVAVSGCGKKNVSATIPTPASASNTAAQVGEQPAALNNPTTPAAAKPNGEPDLAELNRGLIRWIVRNRRPPANFQDFAATAGVTIPPAPPGKKYVIAQNMHIQLVNQ